MKTSLQGISSILADEAIVLTTYDDGADVLSIGAGHTRFAGPPVPTRGMKISLTEAINIFREDLANFEKQVSEAVHVPLRQNQFDAVVSWHYNTGRVSDATLTNKLNAGDMAGAAREFAKWNKAKGKVLKGLVNRRKHETAIFTNADYGDRPIVVQETKGAKKEFLTPSQILDLMGNVSFDEEEQTTEELLKNPKSRLLPRFRPRQKVVVTRAIIDKFEDLIPESRREDSVSVVAVRGYYTNTMGEAGRNDRNLYDDALFVVEPEDVHNFNGNTDPSRFRAGIAKLKSRQSVRYKPGPHGFRRKNGPYPAFRQNSDCTVVRDDKGEDTDSSQQRFWINLHRGGNTTTSSLGCQTVPPHQWNEFKALVDNLLIKYGQENFYYLLVDHFDVPAEDEIMDKAKKASESKQPAETGELADILTHVQALISLLSQAKTGEQVPKPAPEPAKPETAKTLSGLNILITVLQQLARVDNIDPAHKGIGWPPPGPKPAETELTPVNAALGQTVGKALNGRKTGIGIIGLLATTLLPIFVPQLAPVVEVVKEVVTSTPDAAETAKTVVTETTKAMEPKGFLQQLLQSALPAFSAMTGWGVLGKLDKWFNRAA